MNNLRILREKKNITQLKLSIDIGVSQETISAYELGKALPSAETLIKLADYLNTTTDYLLDRTDTNMRIEDIKPLNMTNTDFDLISNYKKLSFENQNRVNGYIEGLLEQ